MKNDTARKLRQVPPGYLIIGIDPHKKTHVAVAMTQGTIIHTRFKFANSRQGYEQVMVSARDQMVKTASRGVIFGIETAGHYWRNLAYFLDEQGIPFRLINPFTLKRMREGKDINRRKTDFRDAEMAAELLRNGEFVETKLPKGIYAELRATYSAYRRLIKERSRAKNLLKGLLTVFSQNLKGERPKCKSCTLFNPLLRLLPDLKPEQIRFPLKYPFWYSVYGYSPSK